MPSTLLPAPAAAAATRPGRRSRGPPPPHASLVVVPPAWPGRAEAPAGGKVWGPQGAGPKPIALLGSTGSIGTQTLDIVQEFPDQYTVVALSAGSNITLLAEQARERCAGVSWPGAQP